MTKGPTGGRVRLTALSLALAACISSGAHAQSNTTGTISGQAGSGDTITAISDDTGFQRSITAGADGTFRFSSLPAGRYRITRTGPDGTATTREVLVNTGTGSSVSFAEAGPSTLDAVQVRGMAAVNPIDLSSVESTTIFTEAQLDALPVARDITDVALLAPGTVGRSALRQRRLLRRQLGRGEPLLHQRLQRDQHRHRPGLQPGAVRGHRRIRW